MVSLFLIGKIAKFGFVSSPFILNYIIQHNFLTNSQNQVASLIKDKFYVDNLIFSSNQLKFCSSLSGLLKK